MKAVVQHQFGGPEVLSYEDLPDPTCGADEVIIDVEAVSINRGLDFGARRGSYNRPVALPHVLGVDPSGMISEMGSEVKGWATGDRVWADFFLTCGRCEACKSGQSRACTETGMLGVTRHGGYAERVAVPARNLHRIPDRLSFAEATVIARHFPAAMYLIEERAAIRRGETVLIMGAMGGLGSACLQLAKQAGAIVIACVGSEQSAEGATDLGADYCVNYREEELLQRVLEITDQRGVDIVCENVGDPTIWKDVFGSLSMGGRLVTAGAHAGGIVELDLHRLYLNRISILGGAGVPPDGIERALRLAEEGQIKAPIAKILPLAQAKRGHQLVEARQTPGKIVLAPKLSN
ncbi:MAG: alcohol dehydrogenase catalytic domain-containing protein [Gammaproteobacteria bacterium]|nr:alcohol dehydrogenase catalytic domain-containing protein [Gammaproteobacteria bacterium]MDH3466427.1 alcohol dehydrogenase catalytic domain-containing protein [Gammaproteobacteria bacterium]